MKKSDIVLSKKELHFKVKGRYGSILRVWKDRLHALVDPDDTIVIYMRLASGEFSVPFCQETVHYVAPNKHLDELLKLGSFTFPIDKEEEIKTILSKLEYAIT